MSEETSYSDASTESLRASVTSYSKSLGTAPAAIPQEHQPYVATILSMDPIRNVRGSLSDDNSVRPGFQPKVEALPPEKQHEARERLSRMGDMSEAERAKAEGKVVSEIMQGMLGSIRAKTGVHPNSLPYHKEMVEIAAQVDTLQRKREVYTNALEKVVDVRKVEDPQTGEVYAEPVMWLSASAQKGYSDAVNEIDRQIRLLVQSDGSFGFEGKKRLDRALAESAAILHKRADAAAKEVEAQALAAKTVRDEEVAKRAEIIAKMKRGGGS